MKSNRDNSLDRSDELEDMKLSPQISNQRTGHANESKTNDNIDNEKLIGDTKPDPMASAFASLGDSTKSKSDRKTDNISQHNSNEHQLPSSSSNQEGHANKSRGRGRARLPEKLMDHLNAATVPGVLWWLPGNESFAIESSRVQSELLDVHFRGTKLSSFIRSLNRWGFRRIFLHSQPKTSICFKAKLFKKRVPHLVGQMQLSSYTPQSSMAASEHSDHDDNQLLPDSTYRPSDAAAQRENSVPPRGETPRVLVAGRGTTGTESLVQRARGSTGRAQEPSVVLQQLVSELQQWASTPAASDVQRTLTSRLHDQLATLAQPSWGHGSLLNQNQLGWNQAAVPRSSANIEASLLQSFLSQNAPPPRPPPPPPAPVQQRSNLGETDLTLQLVQSLLCRGRGIDPMRYPQQAESLPTRGDANDNAALLQLLSNLASPGQAPQQPRPAQQPQVQQLLQQLPQQQLLQLLRQQQLRAQQDPPADPPGPSPPQRRPF